MEYNTGNCDNPNQLTEVKHPAFQRLRRCTTLNLDNFVVKTSNLASKLKNYLLLESKVYLFTTPKASTQFHH